MVSPFLSFDPFVLGKDVLILRGVFLIFMFPFSFNINLRFLKINFIFKAIGRLFPSLEFISFGVFSFLFYVFVVFSLFNLTSLFRFVFTPTSHLLLTFSFGFIFWLRTIFIQLSCFLKRKIEHLTPTGTPIWLIFLMVLIEIVSQCIRPITLSVRLAANLTAGHLILGLLRRTNMFISFLTQVVLFLLELLVALVQPFVFTILLYLYFSEC